MTLEQLRVFVGAVDARSFTRAAARLGVSQSTVSFHVAALEESLGTRLLDRGRGGVRLTHAGEALLPRARDLLGQADATRHELAGGPLGGTVVVEASTVPATFLLPDVLASLGASAPDVGVVLRVSDSLRALRALVERRCDVAVVGSTPSDAGLVKKVIGHDEILLVGRPDQPDPASLDEVPLVVREVDSGTRRVSDQRLRRPGRRVEVGSTEAARRCVLAGVGYTLISDRAVAEDLAAGRLRRFPLDGPPIRRAFHAVRVRAVTPAPAARRLWAALIGP